VASDLMEPKLIWSSKELVSQNIVENYEEYIYNIPVKNGFHMGLLFIKLQHYLDKLPEGDVVTSCLNNGNDTCRVRIIRKLYERAPITALSSLQEAL
jgi:hypothetical protein